MTSNILFSFRSEIFGARKSTEILHALLSGEEKITVNRIFNLFQLRNYVSRENFTKCSIFTWVRIRAQISQPDLGSVRFPPLLHLVAHLPVNTNLLTWYVSVFIRQNILNSSLSWSKSSEANPWYKLYAFQPATVLSNISSFLCLKVYYVSYYVL